MFPVNKVTDPSPNRVWSIHNNDFEPERQLRKKPKLTSQSVQQTQHMRSSSGISKSPSTPTFHSSLTFDDSARPLTSEGVSIPRQKLQRANTSPSHLRHSPHKKPPASHSSYGVETACGPPPSFFTQRTISQDRLRKVQGFTIARPNILHESDEAVALDQSGTLVVEFQKSSQVFEDISSPETADTGSPTTIGGSSLTSLSIVEADTVAISAVPQDKMDGLGVKPREDESKGSSSDERRSEDLFLNIARSDANRDTSTVGDRRRSRISLPFLSNPRTVASQRPSSVRSQFDNDQTITQRPRSKHATAPVAEPLRKRSSTLVSDVGELPLPALVRRNSNATSTGMRPFSRGNQFEKPARPFSDSRALERNATESTISTTAPSTVWDELDDLKSRIRKLELTGKLPPSSAAAMTSLERPRTATTAATTNMSSSPKYKATTATVSAVEGVPVSIHPMLHEALITAKEKVVPEIYQKLQSTVQDALQLAAILTTESGAVSTVGGTTSVERQIRRRTESMCRNLTELTISLSTESKSPAPPAFRPQSRDGGVSTVSGPRSRRLSNDNSDRPSAHARVQSRLENRRLALQNGLRAVQSSPPQASFVPDSADEASPMVSSYTSSRLSRTSTTLGTARGQGARELATRDEDSSPTVRPLSRAMTELATHRQTTRDRAAFSREYTREHPMPVATHPLINDRARLPSNVSSTIVSRRKYMNPDVASEHASSSPLSARETWGRISVVPNEVETPPGFRQANSRRSLGLTSRFGSVGSRLRAVKGERGKQQDQENMTGDDEPQGS